jgi:hypothetical protein
MSQKQNVKEEKKKNTLYGDEKHQAYLELGKASYRERNSELVAFLISTIFFYFSFRLKYLLC